MEILEEQPLTYTEAREVLTSRKKEGELNPVQKLCLDFLDKIPKLPKSKVEKLKEELRNLGLLKEERIVELINSLVYLKEEVGVVLEKENLKRAELEQIATILEKYIK